MAWTSKDLAERARINPRVRSAHSQCSRCMLFYWNRVITKHRRVCKGRDVERRKQGYPTPRKREDT